MGVLCNSGSVDMFSSKKNQSGYASLSIVQCQEIMKESASVILGTSRHASGSLDSRRKWRKQVKQYYKGS